MKIVAISDMHSLYEEFGNRFPMPDGDVLVIAGDIELWTMTQAEKFNKWLGALPYKYIIVIGGNHDKWLATTPIKKVRQVLSNAIYLYNSSVTIEGIKFWGSPITPEFNEWWFMKKRGDEITKVWKKIPNDTDVLITHGPPFQVLDEAPRGLWVEHVGCYDLGRFIRKIKPKVCIFGHIHFAYGEIEQEGIRCYNVSVLNEQYDYVNKATEILI